MRQRHRGNERDPGPPGADGGADELDRLRAAGEDLLAAGDEAIRNALSGDSETFLRAVRQVGGQ